MKSIKQIMYDHLVLACVFGIIFVCFQAGMSCSEGHADVFNPKYKIAIIDTGYNPYGSGVKLKLCPFGHYDFASHLPKISSINAHGTVVGNIIAEKLQDIDYCAVIIQFAKEDNVYPIVNLIGALRKARLEGVNYVNYSIGGVEASIEERKAFEDLIASGAKVFTVAGNEHRDLDFECDYFPACYRLPGLTVVGAFDLDKISNYGKVVTSFESGMGNPKLDGYKRGTSFAVPRALANEVLKDDWK